MTRNKNYSIILHIFLSYVLFIALLNLSGAGLGRIESYLLAFVSAFSSIVYLSYKYSSLFGVNVLLAAIFGFCTKLVIGYMFWQFYMWPDYFSNLNSTLVFDHYEYLFTSRSMEALAELRIENGFFTPPSFDQFLFQGKYIFINYVMSNLYLSGNVNLLDFSVQNSLFSFYTAIVISLIALSLGSTKRKAKIIFIIALFQPFSLISTMIWRDVVGQFFVMFGVYLLLLSFNSRSLKIPLILAISSVSMALLRTVYIFFPIFLYLLKYARDGVVTVRKISILLSLAGLVLLVLYKTSFSQFLGAGYSTYLSSTSSIKFVLLMPIDYFRAFLGPFPWINWLQFQDSTIFLIANYLQAVYVLVIVYFTVRYYKSSNSEFKLYIVVFFFVLLTMSLAPDDIHSEYFTFAASLMLPISAKYLTISRFVMVYGVVFSGFILLNVIYLSLGLHGIGLGANL
jgi:hypothetical protein